MSATTTTTTTTSPMTANIIEVAVNSAKPPVPFFAAAQPSSDALFEFVQAARAAGVLGNVLEAMNLPNYRKDDQH